MQMSFGFLVVGAVCETPFEGYDHFPSIPRYTLKPKQQCNIQIIFSVPFCLTAYVLSLTPLSICFPCCLVVQNWKYLRNDKMWGYVGFTF